MEEQQHAEKGIKEVIYEYNKYGQVVKIKAVTTSDNKEKLVSEYTYYPKGTIKNVKNYTGFDVGNDNYILKTYEYDKFDRITNIKYVNSDNLEKIREEYKFTYDKNGNILTEEIYNDYIIDNKIHNLKSYSYDELGRLIEVQVIDKLNENNKETTSYEYDKVGNRISETKQGITSTYSYNNLNQLLDVKAQGNTLREYTYDENGNTKTEKQGDKTVTYSYDINNQIIDYEEKDNGNVVLTQHNDYDANSQRIRKEVRVNEEESTVNYHYDRGSVLYTTDINNNKISENISDSEMTIRLNNGGISAYKLNSDYKGSVTTIINEQNNGICGYKYDEFGNTEMIGDTNFNNEVCYTGQIYDKETGNYYYNARYYNPQNGRFITMDTYRGEFEEPLSLHLYAYCANDPINYTDPSGHKYDRQKALNWAKNHYYLNWKQYEKTGYYFYRSADCANFVSQCLEKGGIKQSKTWCSTRSKKRGKLPYMAIFDWRKKYNWKISQNWRLVNSQSDYLRKSNMAVYKGGIKLKTNLKTFIKRNKPKVGDILNFKVSPYAQINHAAMINKVTNDKIYYTGHTEKAWDKPVSKYLNENKLGAIYVLHITK